MRLHDEVLRYRQNAASRTTRLVVDRLLICMYVRASVNKGEHAAGVVRTLGAGVRRLISA
jgi:hypothetical protein